MKKTFLISILILFGLGTTMLTGCNVENESVQKTEQKKVEENQNKLSNAVPLPKLTTSLERINIKKRLELFDNENKISYIYLISYGKVMGFYTIKGKVSSGSKRLTTNQKLVNGDRGDNYGDFVMESPSLDGAYGSSDTYIFFWTTDGIYVQWNGEYMLVDEPLVIQTPVALIREIK